MKRCNFYFSFKNIKFIQKENKMKTHGFYRKKIKKQSQRTNAKWI